MKKWKEKLVWFGICNFALILSTFIHECAHGISNLLAGYSVSTGFNRVGNAFAFPHDANFRINFESARITDMGPAITLLLAVIFTIIFYKCKYNNSLLNKGLLGMALSNSIIRLAPMVYVSIRLIFTGNGLEDEIDTGIALAEKSGLGFLTYLPLLISIVISLICLFLILKKYKLLKAKNLMMPQMYYIFFAYITSFIILNILDNYIRINWIPR